MTPVTAQDNHSQVKPLLDKDCKAKEDESDNETKNSQYKTSDKFNTMQNDREENCIVIL